MILLPTSARAEECAPGSVETLATAGIVAIASIFLLRRVSVGGGGSTGSVREAMRAEARADNVGVGVAIGAQATDINVTVCQAGMATADQMRESIEMEMMAHDILIESHLALLQTLKEKRDEDETEEVTSGEGIFGDIFFQFPEIVFFPGMNTTLAGGGIFFRDPTNESSFDSDLREPIISVVECGTEELPTDAGDNDLCSSP